MLKRAKGQARVRPSVLRNRPSTSKAKEALSFWGGLIVPQHRDSLLPLCTKSVRKRCNKKYADACARVRLALLDHTIGQNQAESSRQPALLVGCAISLYLTLTHFRGTRFRYGPSNKQKLWAAAVARRLSQRRPRSFADWRPARRTRLPDRCTANKRVYRDAAGWSLEEHLSLLYKYAAKLSHLNPGQAMSARNARDLPSLDWTFVEPKKMH